MDLKKGMKLYFPKSNRTEIIIKGSRNPVMGMITTDCQEYSCDFILTWLNYGFAKLYDKKGVEIQYKRPNPLF